MLMDDNKYIIIILQELKTLWFISFVFLTIQIEKRTAFNWNIFSPNDVFRRTQDVQFEHKKQRFQNNSHK